MVLLIEKVKRLFSTEKHTKIPKENIDKRKKKKKKGKKALTWLKRLQTSTAEELYLAFEMLLYTYNKNEYRMNIYNDKN